MNYRVLEGPRGYLDLRAGVRYTNLYSQVAVTPSDGAIDRASAAFVDDVSNRLQARLQERLSQLDVLGLLRSIVDPRIEADLTSRLSAISAKRPDLQAASLEAGLPGRAGEAIDRIIDRKLADLTAALQAAEAADKAALAAAVTADTAAARAAAFAKAQAIRSAAQARRRGRETTDHESDCFDAQGRPQ